jgi:hypothetical protein
MSLRWREIERKKIDYTEDELKHLTAAHIAKHYPTPHKLGITDLNKCTLCATEQHTRGHLLRCRELKDIKDALPKNMAEPEKESYLYWETRKRMMAK